MTESGESRLLAGSAAVAAALERIAREVLDDLPPGEEVLVVGVHGKGVIVSDGLSRSLESQGGRRFPRGTLDVGMHRDDLDRNPAPRLQPMSLPSSIEDRTVLLVDDVIHSGRTVRAALDALHDYGRPRRVLLAVLMDRGGRRLPIRPDYTGETVAVEEGQRIRIQNLEEGEGLEAYLDGP